MTDLPSLLSRVMEAEGPDRELARDVFEALTGECTHRNTHFVYLENDERELECSDCGADTYGKESRWSSLTASLDAALALVERVLPGWGWSITKKGDVSWACVNAPDASYELVHGEHAHPALALLAALIRSKMEPEPSHD